MNKVLVQSSSITSKTELNIYYKNLNIRIISIVSERLKSEDISKEGNIKKIRKLHRDTAEHPAPPEEINPRHQLPKAPWPCPIASHFITPLKIPCTDCRAQQNIV